MWDVNKGPKIARNHQSLKNSIKDFNFIIEISSITFMLKTKNSLFSELRDS